MDAAFKTAPFPGYTTAELKAAVARRREEPRILTNNHMIDQLEAEIERRAKVEAGDYSVATDGERLRAVRAGKL